MKKWDKADLFDARANPTIHIEDRRSELLKFRGFERPQSILHDAQYGGQLGFQVWDFPAGQETGATAYQFGYGNGVVPQQGSSDGSSLYAPTIRAAGCIEVGTDYDQSGGSTVYIYDFCLPTPGFVEFIPWPAMNASGFLPFAPLPIYVVETLENGTQGSSVYFLQQLVIPGIPSPIYVWALIYSTKGTSSYEPHQAGICLKRSITVSMRSARTFLLWSRRMWHSYIRENG